MRVLTAMVVLGLSIGVIVWSGIPTVDPSRTGAEYVALFDEADLIGLVDPGDPVPITAEPDVDARIRAMAEARGYRLRPVADTDDLQLDVQLAWEAFQTAALDAGHDLVLVSGFRSRERQREYFLGALANDLSEASIERALVFTAPPGYSKHQTGYAIDLGVRDTDQFHTTEAFGWITADEYAVARRFGFIPSYPPDGGVQGPDPEAWEFVWVGRETIRCGIGNHVCRFFARDE